tara:strand:- start:891 stop:2222 length:1332 start_codon:yes stop_codon:yes gene_type:complete
MVTTNKYYSGYTTANDKLTGTPFDLLGKRIPIDRKRMLSTKGRSTLDNLYGISTNPSIQANPPSRYVPNLFPINNSKRNFSRSNLTDKQKKDIINQSYIRNNLPVPASPVSNQKMIEMANARKMQNQTVDTATPNLKDNLLNFVASPYGEGMAQGLLEASGYSNMPTSIGQALALGMQRGNEAESNQLATRLSELQIEKAEKDLETPAAGTKREIKKLADNFLYYVDPTGKTPPERVDKNQVKNTDEADLKKQETTFKQANDLRDEHTKNSGEFVKVRDAYGRILASGTNPSPAGDLALIFNYMKMLDPGSTVREGEFANAENSGSIPDRFIAQYNKIREGTRLSQAQRDDFLGRSESLYAAAKDTQAYLDESYTELAGQFNVDPKQVIIDFDKPIRKKKFKYDLDITPANELVKMDISGFDEDQKKIFNAILDKKLKELEKQ